MNVYALRRPSVPVLEDLTGIPLIFTQFYDKFDEIFLLKK